MDYNLDYDWGAAIPIFPDLLSEPKMKCCPKQQILARIHGKWGCVKEEVTMKEIMQCFEAFTHEGESLEIEYIEKDISSICSHDYELSFWKPKSIDFLDDSAVSDEREDFIECLDVSKDSSTNKLHTVVASCSLRNEIGYCYEGETERMIYIIFGLVSILSILLSLTVYGLLPKQLLNQHGKVLSVL